MRTTLDIDQDILLAAKELAGHQGLTAGKVISQLARQGLARSNSNQTRNGFPLFPYSKKNKIVTLELVNRLRDELS
jgi:hypothetical protein